jgi:hypothetical protein
VPPRRARSLVNGLITSGREAGTPGAAAARAVISRFLTDLGYTVQEHSFGFNAGIYRALPAAGLLLMILAAVEVPRLLGPGPAWGAAAALLLFTGAAAITTLRFVAGDGAPGWERTDANLVAHRKDANVRCWLVAHLDTKAQGQSMAGRLVALWFTVAALVMLLAAAWSRVSGPLSLVWSFAAGGLGVVAGLLLLGGRLKGQSPGARDNGSGLLAVLTAAELATDPGIGIILTGAEEFGLAGARALARERPSLFEHTDVVNVDTIDDEGTLFVVAHEETGLLAGRVRARVAGLAPVRGRRLPLGIMVDGIPLARVASETVTLGRLSWGTLRRLHTPRDNATGYGLATAELLGERLALPI